MNGSIYNGKVFMYPCSGKDIVTSVEAFGEQFDTFLFVDLNYRFRGRDAPIFSGWDLIDGSRRLDGPAIDAVKKIQEGKHRYREIHPAWFRLQYRNIKTGRTIDVVLRRGFGQYALQEIADGSLAMFLHRGDSNGEAGSGTFFLANRKMDHAPLSMLLDVIKRKLAYPALIGSDGSNTTIRQLFTAGEGDESITQFTSHGLLWQRVGTLKARDCRHTIVWQVYPQNTLSRCTESIARLSP